MIMWHELGNSHALITEILFLFDQFIQQQTGTLRPLLPSSSLRELPNKRTTDNYMVQTILKAINICSIIYNISQWFITLNIKFVS
jgi:hypothetical protein